VKGSGFERPAIRGFGRDPVVVFGVDIMTIIDVIMIKADVMGIMTSVIWEVDSVSVLHVILVGSIE
jgi:hypothetical protein